MKRYGDKGGHGLAVRHKLSAFEMRGFEEVFLWEPIKCHCIKTTQKTGDKRINFFNEIQLITFKYRLSFTERILVVVRHCSKVTTFKSPIKRA